jgi:hypothetical protein
MRGATWKIVADRRAIVLPALVAVAFIVLQLVDVASYPLAVPDEAFLNDAGLQLVRTGRFHSTSGESTAPRCL